MSDSENTLVPAEVLTSKRRYRDGARAHTESIRRISKSKLAAGAAEFPETDHHRPWTRGECVDGERPCPFVSCRYHLALDVHPERGSIKHNFPDLDVDEMPETCALDIADRGGITLEEVGALTNMTRERVRQVETAALAKAERRLPMFRLGPESVV